MNTFELNSDLLDNFVSCAMYCTTLDSDNVLYIYEDELVTTESYLDMFDFNLYKEHVKKFIEQNLTSVTFGDIHIDFKIGEIHSPKYYNYHNDTIDVDVTVDVDKLYKYVYEQHDDFNTFLDRYKSSSGFVSFMPSNIEEFYSDEYEDYRLVACMLNFLAEQYDFEAIDEDYISENIEIGIFDVVSKKTMDEYYLELSYLELLISHDALDIDKFIENSIYIKNETGIVEYIFNR